MLGDGSEIVHAGQSAIMHNLRGRSDSIAKCNAAVINVANYSCV